MSGDVTSKKSALFLSGTAFVIASASGSLCQASPSCSSVFQVGHFAATSQAGVAPGALSTPLRSTYAIAAERVDISRAQRGAANADSGGAGSAQSPNQASTASQAALSAGLFSAAAGYAYDFSAIQKGKGFPQRTEELLINAGKPQAKGRNRAADEDGSTSAEQGAQNASSDGSAPARRGLDLGYILRLGANSPAVSKSLQEGRYQMSRVISIAALVERAEKISQADGEGQSQLRMMQALAQKGEYRLAITPPEDAAFDELRKEMPNFAPVIDFILDSIAYNRVMDQPIRLTPILLDGDPGIGKTYFVERLAEVLGTVMHKISGTEITAPFILSGADSTFKGAKMGEIATAVLLKGVANSVVLVDELDKVARTEHNPMRAFYNLFEEVGARRWKDEYLGVEIDASQLIFIATANDITQIPAPILSRLHRVYVKPPTEAEKRAIIDRIMAKAVGQLPKDTEFDPSVSNEVFKAIDRLSIRGLNKYKEALIGSALRDGRRRIDVKDVEKMIIRSHNEEQQGARRPIGFIENKGTGK